MKKFLKCLMAMAGLLAFCTVGVNAASTTPPAFKVVAVLSELTSLRPQVGDVAFVLGWSAVGDGGGGLYRCATSSSSTNYGCVTSSINTARQWIRLPGLNGFTAAPRTQTLTAASNIVAEAQSIRVAGSGGAVTLTNLPTITTNGIVNGQILVIEGTHDSNTVAIQDEAALSGSKIQLGVSTNRTLGAGDILLLKYNSTLGTWQEAGFVNN